MRSNQVRVGRGAREGMARTAVPWGVWTWGNEGCRLATSVTAAKTRRAEEVRGGAERLRR